jgi:hypothetical protein
VTHAPATKKKQSTKLWRELKIRELRIDKAPRVRIILTVFRSVTCWVVFFHLVDPRRYSIDSVVNGGFALLRAQNTGLALLTV